jgi:nucleotide-binding universal stress UspA family protein
LYKGADNSGIIIAAAGVSVFVLRRLIMGRTGHQSSQGTVIVALNFNSQSKVLVDTAVGMCQRSGWGLRLLHVVTPPPSVVWYGEITPGLRLADLAEAELEISKNEAKFKLEQIAKGVPANIDVSVSVVADDVAEGVLTETKSKEAKLLVCGSIGGSYRFVPKSMSTLLSLMAQAPIPVLVLNDAAPHAFPQDRLKIIVLDDLSEETAHIFHGNFKFLSHVKEIDVLHVHVSGLNKATLAAALTAANAASRNGVNLEVEVDDLFSSMQDKAIKRLQERSADLRTDSENRKIHYKTQIEYGNIHDAIDRLTKAFQPDILCFGKHSSIRHKPFALGQVPYSSMLANKLPVLILSGEGC